MPVESFNGPSKNHLESKESDEKNLKKTKRRVAIIDTSSALEDQARDRAEQTLTASKEDLKGIRGFFSKIWKHNLFREYYRQREIAQAKSDILTSENIYAGEQATSTAHEQAMQAVVERFTQEYEEAIHKEAGEQRKVVETEKTEDRELNASVRALIKEYASGAIDDGAFLAERGRIIAQATGMTQEAAKNAVNHADNLFEIAKQSKLAVEHGASLDEIDQEIELVIGKAKLGVRTESHYNTVDALVQKIQSSKVGQLVNETTVASAVAIAYSITAGLSQKLARSKAFAWGTFGASVLVGGAIAGARESTKIEDERRQHARDKAKGKEI